MAFIETGEHGGESRSRVERKIRCSVLVVLFCQVQGPGLSLRECWAGSQLCWRSGAPGMVRAVATDSEWAAHTDTSSSVQYLSL